MTPPIIKTVELPCSAAYAFNVFVGQIGQWWPLDSHAASASSGQRAQDVVIEPRVGGRIIETTHDGGTDLWGEVLEVEPGARLAFSWHPGNSKDHPTRVEIVFQDGGNDICRVTLTHSGWEAGAKRDDYDSGWDMVFGQRFAQACDS
jgi:uncharacterized protein YndB with AHSA1/START domain